ncbi:carbohydrate ABC transporter permease [Paenibacillus sp. SAF-054]|uniref:carbohydrate ABC transporter permease n=1 Tax=unclassified Paenibacillus TaxID=185978 RepID=UPI003F7F5A22
MTTTGKLRRAVPKKIPLYLGALLLFLIYAVPLLLILINSVKSEAESSIMNFRLPSEFRFDNYWTVLQQGQVIRGFFNGMFISATVTLLTILLCSISAFIIQRNRTRFTAFTYQYLLAGMIAPFSFIPAIKLLQLLHMGNNYSGLIMVDLAGQIPFTILLYTGFAKGIPRELDEASIMDGCGPVRLFYQIIFPLLKPVISANIVLTFTAIWNDFGNVLYLVPKSSMWTMPMSVFNFQGFHTYNYGLVCAFIVIALLPVLVIYIAGQKFIISGMTAGAVKG